MTTIDLCPDRAWYFNQLNNEQDPKIACQSTTAAQCLAIIGEIDRLKGIGPFRQPEDNLRWFCKNDKECMELCLQSHGKNWNMFVYHPSEWADVLVFAINKLVGYKAARFDGNITIEKIVADLAMGLPIQVSLRFIGISGHYVSVIGCFNNGDLLINDPYRNWLHNNEDGFHVRYTPNDWANHSKGYGLRYIWRV